MNTFNPVNNRIYYLVMNPFLGKYEARASLYLTDYLNWIKVDLTVKLQARHFLL